MNNLQEKIEIIRAMEKGLTIQYSETDGEEDDWEDLKTTELDFDLYTYRVKPNSKPKSNPDARFKVGDKLVRIADEGKLNPLIVTIRDFASNGDYRWEEIKGQTNIEAIDANYLNINDVCWWHVIHYKKEDRYTLAPTMMKLGEIKGWANETYSPMFEMGFRIPRGEENESRRED
jgi:hypothetical protein|nr:MAG TPA: hypothetical protein [Caudoviricetes sp.]